PLAVLAASRLRAAVSPKSAAQTRPQGETRRGRPPALETVSHAERRVEYPLGEDVELGTRGDEERLARRCLPHVDARREKERDAEAADASFMGTPARGSSRPTCPKTSARSR